MRGEDIYYLWITNHWASSEAERESDNAGQVVTAGSCLVTPMFLLAGHDIITLSRVKSQWQGLQLSPVGTMPGGDPANEAVQTSDQSQARVRLITVRGPSRLWCRPTFIRGHIMWVRPSKYQQKESPSWERDVRRTFYHFHFPIFCRPSHLSSVAAVASLNRRLQCISGDKRIVNKYWSRTIRVSLHNCTLQVDTIVDSRSKSVVLFKTHLNGRTHSTFCVLCQIHDV